MGFRVILRHRSNQGRRKRQVSGRRCVLVSWHVHALLVFTRWLFLSALGVVSWMCVCVCVCVCLSVCGRECVLGARIYGGMCARMAAADLAEAERILFGRSRRSTMRIDVRGAIGAVPCTLPSHANCVSFFGLCRFSPSLRSTAVWPSTRGCHS